MSWILFLVASASCAPKPLDPYAGLEAYSLPDDEFGSPYCFDPDSEALRAAWTSPRPNADNRLNARDLASDVVTLHQILQDQYAGYAELLQNRSFNPNAFFEQWRIDLTKGPKSVTFQVGVLDYLVALKQAHLDNHLSVAGWSHYLNKQTRLVEYQHSLQVMSGCNQNISLIFQSALMAYEASENGLEPIATISASDLGDQVYLECSNGTFELQRRHSKARSADQSLPSYEWKSINEVALITIRRFGGNHQDIANLKSLAEDYGQHQQHKLIVFDLRGNSGGDGTHMWAWARQAFTGKAAHHVSLEVFGKLAPCGIWNWRIANQIQSGEVDSAESIAEQKRLRKEMVNLPTLHRVSD
ncbi:MAG: hypothetical protein HN348_14465, partial [Proteobacteria bacterium]|nr:hypothetical protein [Pseudomonadota bacterium]